MSSVPATWPCSTSTTSMERWCIRMSSTHGSSYSCEWLSMFLQHLCKAYAYDVNLTMLLAMLCYWSTNSNVTEVLAWPCYLLCCVIEVPFSVLHRSWLDHATCYVVLLKYYFLCYRGLGLTMLLAMLCYWSTISNVTEVLVWPCYLLCCVIEVLFSVLQRSRLDHAICYVVLLKYYFQCYRGLGLTMLLAMLCYWSTNSNVTEVLAWPCYLLCCVIEVPFSVLHRSWLGHATCYVVLLKYYFLCYRGLGLTMLLAMLCYWSTISNVTEVLVWPCYLLCCVIEVLFSVLQRSRLDHAICYVVLLKYYFQCYRGLGLTMLLAMLCYWSTISNVTEV